MKFESLMGFQAESKSETGLELSFCQSNSVCDREYMDIVNHKLHLNPRGKRLKGTCSKWPKLIRELKAVVLFGVRFQDIIQPIATSRLCPELRTLSKGKDLLAMEVDMLQELCRDSGLRKTETLRRSLSRVHISGDRLTFLMLVQNHLMVA